MIQHKGLQCIVFVGIYGHLMWATYFRTIDSLKKNENYKAWLNYKRP